MSQLEHAKREAKRLYKLAQSYPTINQKAHLPMDNLSQAREYISIINGYKNWHDYEENLKRKDFFQSQSYLSAEENSDTIDLTEIHTYKEPCEFIAHIHEPKMVSYETKNRVHKPAFLAQSKKKLFKQDEKWLLNSFPATFFGATGAGKTESMCSMLYQWFENAEGGIYFDGKGDSVLYNKVFSMLEETQRTTDLYVLNFMTGSRDALSQPLNSKFSNSIDPINPLIGSDTAFQLIFGETIGLVIHEIAKVAKTHNMLLDYQNIRAMLSLNNLLNWSQNGLWSSATGFIKNYLSISLGLDIQNTEALESMTHEKLVLHARFCEQAKNMTDLIEHHSQYGVFSLNPEIDMQAIFSERKCMVVLLPALEKSIDMIHLLSLLTLVQVRHFADLFETKGENKNCWQNIIIDEANLTIHPKMQGWFFKDLPRKTNWVFGFQDMGNEPCLLDCTRLSSTLIFMKSETPVSIMAPELKLKVLENLPQPPDIFYMKGQNKMRSLHEGEAFIFTQFTQASHESEYVNTQAGFHFGLTKLAYHMPSKARNIHINRPLVPRIHFTDITLSELLGQ